MSKAMQQKQLTPQCVSSSNKELLKQIYKLRTQVWIEMGAPIHLFPNEMLVDQYDDQAYHWIIVQDDKLVAAARLSIHTDLSDAPEAQFFEPYKDFITFPVASMNRLVVQRNARSKSCGKQLTLAQIEMARQKGCKTAIIYCGPPTSSKWIKSLENIGFLRLSPTDHSFKDEFGPLTPFYLKL